MDLTLNLIRCKLEKLGVTGTYPSSDNCYKVKIEDPRGEEFSFVSDYFPKPVYNMAVTLKALKDKYKVSDSDLLEMIKYFNEHGDYSYNKAMSDCAMDDAGASI